ncbi:Peroxiredoxin-5, mitochondrial [Cytospora mali]|uniref:Peroxiredoxin-5, mitochondrial n=1 Tax=Cytospora mali TaxID=578113 RepID=A0A194V2S9_CYTMA|nr:Peroxiredoxin-5, mitochondrial [Valsa mali var. pyri (nom. inval.)]
MAFRTSLRPLTLTARSGLASATSRGFHSTRPAFVKVGDAIPNLEVLTENSPANKVNLAKELSTGNGIIIGVPGAFSPGCSQKHIPSYLTHPNLTKAGKVFVVAVNDPFVMKAWGEALDPSATHGVRFVADPSAEFTSALELDFDATKIFGNVRSKRYALVVENGKVKSAHVEPDGTGTNESMADKVLGASGSTDWNA